MILLIVSPTGLIGLAQRYLARAPKAEATP
jgi:hypothetical protein